jgi:spore maturation protein SpmA
MQELQELNLESEQVSQKSKHFLQINFSLK